jgi:hypothetical protein
MIKLFTWLLISSICTTVIANEKPYFTSTPITSIGEDMMYQYYITVADPDNDTLILILNDKPNDLLYLDLGNDTAILYGVLITSLENSVSISVTDKIDTVTQEFQITVLCPNCCASFTSEPITIATVDSLYTYNISAIDVDKNVILSIDTLPDWLSFDYQYPNNAKLFGIPSISDTGTYEIEIKAERESTLCPNATYQIFNLKVSNNPVSINQSKRINDNFNIVPNPFIDRLSIYDYNNILFPAYVEIYDTMGQLIYSNLFSDFTNSINLDLIYIKTGLYFIRITNQKTTQTFKIRKQ